MRIIIIKKMTMSKSLKKGKKKNMKRSKLGRNMKHKEMSMKIKNNTLGKNMLKMKMEMKKRMVNLTIKTKRMN